MNHHHCLAYLEQLTQVSIEQEAGWNYFAKKAKTSEKSENISKAKIVLMFSQNSELDCVDSFCFCKVDLLFCEIISKPRNPRI